MSEKRKQTQESLTRTELEERYGRVLNTRELAQEYVVVSTIGDRVVVRRKADDVAGQMVFTDSPRYYHSFKSADPPPEAG